MTRRMLAGGELERVWKRERMTSQGEGLAEGERGARVLWWECGMAISRSCMSKSRERLGWGGAVSWKEWNFWEWVGGGGG